MYLARGSLRTTTAFEPLLWLWHILLVRIVHKWNNYLSWKGHLLVLSFCRVPTPTPKKRIVFWYRVFQFLRTYVVKRFPSTWACSGAGLSDFSWKHAMADFGTNFFTFNYLKKWDANVLFIVHSCAEDHEGRVQSPRNGSISGRGLWLEIMASGPISLQGLHLSWRYLRLASGGLCRRVWTPDGWFSPFTQFCAECAVQDAALLRVLVSSSVLGAVDDCKKFVFPSVFNDMSVPTLFKYAVTAAEIT